MSERIETVGEVVDRRGPCALMAAVVRLAEAHRRIPVGFWRVELEPGWELVINGTKETREHLPPWNSLILKGGLPLVMFDAADGVQLGLSEAESLAVLERAIQAAGGRGDE